MEMLVQYARWKKPGASDAAAGIKQGPCPLLMSTRLSPLADGLCPWIFAHTPWPCAPCPCTAGP